ncbi:MAG: iron ABC transporter permease [Pelolinea sp.]|nr:iron ABC transporter permease [Pelolinea sp.]
MREKRLYGLIFCLVLVTLASFFIGRYQLNTPFNLFGSSNLFKQLFFHLRIPRVLTALLIGSGLALAGLVTQIIFQNPLADGGLLGVSQAAGFGAALGILIFKGNPVWIQLFAFGFGVFALLISILISGKVRDNKILSLILAGIAVSAVFSAGIGILKYLADPVDQLPTIVYWLLGSLAGSTWLVLLRTFVIIFPVMVFFWFYRWRLNLHAMDKEVAYSLGLQNKFELWLNLVASVLLTSSIISISGVVGWVGLIIPNYARMIAGSDTSNSIPVTILLGGIFAIVCDDLARALLPGEIPLGIFTALLGSLMFIGLLLKKEKFA